MTLASQGMLLLADAHPMVEKLSHLHAEIVLFIATVVVMVLGLSHNASMRRACGGVSVIALIVAGVLGWITPDMDHMPMPGMSSFLKVVIAAVGILLVLLVEGTVDRAYEHKVRKTGVFDGLRSTRGEFYAFLLFSLTGLMLTTGADDLIWLFLALELTSLPTYVMVSISTSRARSQEAGVKYFFLGAMGAAIFLYGFALLYGAAGTTMLFGENSIASVFATNGIGAMGMLGLVMAVIGVSFKIAAVPMHFYTADVYEGAASSVSAFLAFVPKLAGFTALILLLSVVGWTHGEAGGSLPDALRIVLWVMAALTMTVGNVLAIMQKSVKRMLAYSSVAHSGYMLVGLVVGPALAGGTLATNGLAAVLFYMLCYGFMNLGAFGVLASLERAGAGGESEEAETFGDIRGLCKTSPVLGWSMVLCALSLLGFPPLLGFFGKLFLFTSAISAGEILLVVVMGLNSAIAAFYYLRLVIASLIDEPTSESRTFGVTAFGSRVVASAISAGSVVVLVLATSWLMGKTGEAVSPEAATDLTAVDQIHGTFTPGGAEE
jgi:NADH-quinone oxidoreductase subunit N